MQVGEFGDKFRKAREKKGISLDDASNVTKIGARMLQAIEEEHFDQLPGGVFNKGFIRAYAKHLGINDQEAVTEYLECLRQEQVRAQAVWEPQSRPTPPEKRPPSAAKGGLAKTPKPEPVRVPTVELADLQMPKAEHVRRPRQKYLERGEAGMPWRLVAATVVVLLLIVILWRRHAIRESSASAATATTVSAPVNPAVAASNGPGNGSGSPSGSAVPGNAPVSPSTGNASTGNSKTTTKPSPDAESGDDDVTTRSFVQPAVAAKPAMPLTLVIRATENSYVSVSADGRTVTQETLIAPANTLVRASREIVARVGNAAGVTFVWNGKEIPADGAEAEVKTFIFDAQGMHVAGANQAPAQN